jgi:hypothetical protein
MEGSCVISFPSIMYAFVPQIFVGYLFISSTIFSYGDSAENKTNIPALLQSFSAMVTPCIQVNSHCYLCHTNQTWGDPTKVLPVKGLQGSSQTWKWKVWVEFPSLNSSKYVKINPINYIHPGCFLFFISSPSLDGEKNRPCKAEEWADQTKYSKTIFH